VYQGWRGQRGFSPDLEREVQERQVKVQFLLLVGALVGEVAGGFRRAGECCGAVLNDIVLALFLQLTSPTFFFPVFVLACHGGGSSPLGQDCAVSDKPMISDTIYEWYGFGRCVVKAAGAGFACVRIVTVVSAIAAGSVRRRAAARACGRPERSTSKAATDGATTPSANGVTGSANAPRA